MRIKNLKQFISVLIFALASFQLVSFAASFKKKGCGGSYFIAGKAFSKSKKNIVRGSIFVFYGEHKSTIKTSENGDFEAEIEWMNACKSGLSAKEHENENKRINPERIFFVFKEDTLSILNEWKRFGKCFPKNKEEITLNKNLYFKK